MARRTGSGTSSAARLHLEDLERRDCPAAITIADVSVNEGTTNSPQAMLTLSLSSPSSSAVTVDWRTVDRSATVADRDYRAASGTVRFAPGQTSRTIAVTVVGDPTIEPDETFGIELSNPVGATLTRSTATCTIRNDDVVQAVIPSITVSDTEVPERNTGRSDASFTVSLSAATNVPVTVAYATKNGTATADNRDYVPSSSRLTFQPGETTKNVAIGVLGDSRIESNETFMLVLMNPQGATLAGGIGTATIVNDDFLPTPLPAVSVTGGSVVEGGGGSETAVTFTVTLAGTSFSQVTVGYETVDGTATVSDGDYRKQKGTLLFQPGETTKMVSVGVIGDSKAESDESFGLVLTKVTGATIARAAGTATGTIIDDDTPPVLRIADVSVQEGDAGTTPASFVITLNRPWTQAVTVNYATRDGSATVANSDYVAATGLLTFAPGETSKTVAVNINGDITAEADETFVLVLSTPTNATLARTSGVATIRNDDDGEVPGFQITVDYLGTVRQSIKDACDWAAQRWSQIITGDLPGVQDGETFTDDLRIEVREGLLGGGDGPGETLANARPTNFRSGTPGLPWKGESGVDTFDAGNPQLKNILLHEFGHVLGFGGFAGFTRFVVGTGFTGANAVREYRALFGGTATSVPLETGGGSGTAGAHWSEAVLKTELMTGYAEAAGVAMPISRITVGALEDLGYQVNYSAADAFAKPIRAAAAVTPPPASAWGLTGLAVRPAPAITAPNGESPSTRHAPANGRVDAVQAGAFRSGSGGRTIKTAPPIAKPVAEPVAASLARRQVFATMIAGDRERG